VIAKVLAHGSKGNPFAYLLERKREVAAELLRGDPVFCLATIRALRFRQKYTSVVLTFAEELTPERERQIMDDYERVAFGGRAEEFTWVWIRHREHGRTELHLVVANVHLPTGKRWSHYYDRADRKLFKAWQELTNLCHDLASPDAPERMRLADVPSRKLPAEKKALFEKLDKLVCEGVARGRIQTRVDLVRTLEAEGFEVRLSRNFIAVKPSGSEEKALRLRGKKYGEEFTREALLVSSRPRTAEEEAERKRCLEKDFAEALARRTVFVERVCQPRKKRRKKPSDKVPEEAIHEDDALYRNLTGPPPVATPTEPKRTIPQLEKFHESRPRNSLSESIRRADQAGRNAVLAGRSAAWGARVAASFRRLTRAIRRFRSGADRDGGRNHMALPGVCHQSLFVGSRRFSGLFGRLFWRASPGAVLPWLGRGRRSAPVLGAAGPGDRERDRTPGIPR
jgi:hypothetical protein